MDHLILFTGLDLRDEHRHMFSAESNLDASDDNVFNDNVRSLVVLGGAWTLFSDPGFQTFPFTHRFGEGSHGLPRHDISSVSPSGDFEILAGAPIKGELILFEHRDFRGDHKHIFGDRRFISPSIFAQAVPGEGTEITRFNNLTSSMVVLNGSGSWQFFRDADRNIPFSPLVGQGSYPDVFNIGIEHDAISSLMFFSNLPTIFNTIPGHVILFEHRNFRGAHCHVFKSVGNLEVLDFDDRISSFAILSGICRFFRHPRFRIQSGRELGPGIYPWVEDFGIDNDDISSIDVIAPPSFDFSQQSY